MSGNLILHRGAREATLDQIARVDYEWEGPITSR